MLGINSETIAQQSTKTEIRDLMAMTIGCSARPIHPCPFPSYEHLNPVFSVVKEFYLEHLLAIDVMNIMMSW